MFVPVAAIAVSTGARHPRHEQLFVRPVLLPLQHCVFNTEAKNLELTVRKLDIFSKTSGHGLTEFWSVVREIS